MPEKLLTVAEVARTLGLSEAEVVRLAQAGTLKAIRLGGELLRFHPEDLAAWQATHRRPGPAPRPLGGRGSWGERAWDFLYAYDFYLLAVLVIGTIVGLIFSTQF